MNLHMKARARGFTLIELLVVIAIIGLLAAIVLASVNSARVKGRDARRLADLKQISNAAAIADNSLGGVAFTGCTTKAEADTCTLPNLANFKDPGGNTALCSTGATGSACDYTVMTAGATTQKFEVCDFTEGQNAVNTTSAGANVNITQDGVITAGCN